MSAPPSRVCEAGDVVRLALEDGEEGLTLTLRIQTLDRNRLYDVRFIGVLKLRFRGESTFLPTPVLLLLEDVSADQWEGVRFRVWDAEEEFVSFYCRAIDPLP